MNLSSPHLLKNLSQLAGQLAKISADVNQLTASLLLSEVDLRNRAELPAAQTEPVPLTTPSAEMRPKPASKTEVLASVKVARDVIGQRNRPVQVSDLFKEVRVRGFEIHTAKPVQTYASRIRDYRIRVGLIYLEGFGWWPIERPYPPANYTPVNITRIGKHIA